MINETITIMVKAETLLDVLKGAGDEDNCILNSRELHEVLGAFVGLPALVQGLDIQMGLNPCDPCKIGCERPQSEEGEITCASFEAFRKLEEALEIINSAPRIGPTDSD